MKKYITSDIFEIKEYNKYFEISNNNNKEIKDITFKKAKTKNNFILKKQVNRTKKKKDNQQKNSNIIIKTSQINNTSKITNIKKAKKINSDIPSISSKPYRKKKVIISNNNWLLSQPKNNRFFNSHETIQKLSTIDNNKLYRSNFHLRTISDLSLKEFEINDEFNDLGKEDDTHHIHIPNCTGLLKKHKLWGGDVPLYKKHVRENCSIPKNVFGNKKIIEKIEKIKLKKIMNKLRSKSERKSNGLLFDVAALCIKKNIINNKNKKIDYESLSKYEDLYSNISVSNEKSKIKNITTSLQGKLTFYTDKSKDLIINNIKNLNESDVDNNSTIIVNSNSELISGRKNDECSENISEKEDEKFSLPIHQLNNYNFTNGKKRIGMFERIIQIPNNLFLSPKKENNYKLKKCIGINNDINKKCLTSIRKMPISFERKKHKKIKLFDNNSTLYHLFELNNNLINYLDFKTIIILSSINKKFYTAFRKFLFEFLLNILFTKDKKQVKRIIKSVYKYRSNYLRYKNLKEIKKIYINNLYKSEFDDSIKKDLTRTFPDDLSFKRGEKNYKKLYNILTSYSNYNKSIGYAQGLNFISANAIYFFNSEEEVFLFLDSIVNRFELFHLMSIDNKYLIPKLNYFSNILSKHVPDIINYFTQNQLNHGFFSTKWILTLFSISMQRKYLLNCWAFMVILGWKFFYSFVVQVLKFYKKDIIETNVKDLRYKMQNILQDGKFEKNYYLIIKNTLGFMKKNISL